MRQAIEKEFILNVLANYTILKEAFRSNYFNMLVVANKYRIAFDKPLLHSNDNNKTRIWKITEMDADHVTAWSKGGATDIKNC